MIYRCRAWLEGLYATLLSGMCLCPPDSMAPYVRKKARATACEAATELLSLITTSNRQHNGQRLRSSFFHSRWQQAVCIECGTSKQSHGSSLDPQALRPKANRRCSRAYQCLQLHSCTPPQICEAHCVDSQIFHGARQAARQQVHHHRHLVVNGMQEHHQA